MTYQIDNESAHIIFTIIQENHKKDEVGGSFSLLPAAYENKESTYHPYFSMKECKSNKSNRSMCK